MERDIEELFFDELIGVIEEITTTASSLKYSLCLLNIASREC